jgi:hypothetical protein
MADAPTRPTMNAKPRTTTTVPGGAADQPSAGARAGAARGMTSPADSTVGTAADDAAHTAPEKAPGFLRVMRRGISLAARTMRLREGDILVGVNGQPFTDGMSGLSLLFEELDDLDEKDPQPLLLTFWRDGIFFHQLHSILPRFAGEVCEPDLAMQIAKKFETLEFAPLVRYENYEVFRDISRVCGMHSATTDPLALLAPPLWMLNNRLTFPLLAILIVYGITFLTHWAMFLVSYVLISIYTQKAQLNLLRSYQVYDERFFWNVVAETDENRARDTCRAFDPEITFLMDPKPKKKRKKASAPGKSRAQPTN